LDEWVALPVWDAENASHQQHASSGATSEIAHAETFHEPREAKDALPEPTDSPQYEEALDGAQNIAEEAPDDEITGDDADVKVVEERINYVDDPNVDAEDLRSLGFENVSIADFAADDDASMRLAKHQIESAELNLEVIRKFPHMALWEGQLHSAVDEAGGPGGAQCAELRDTVFRGYGCAIADRGEPLCLCKGGREECVIHDEEDALNYLWMMKENRTVDENVMRELLAGRCDYTGGHELSAAHYAEAAGALLLPILLSCAFCFCPVLIGVATYKKKRRSNRAKAALLAAQKHRPVVQRSASRASSCSGSGHATPAGSAAEPLAMSPAALRTGGSGDEAAASKHPAATAERSQEVASGQSVKANAD